MKYTPVSDDDLDNFPTIPDGTTCSATVRNAEDYVSKVGKESIKLTLAVIHDGQEHTIWCYITPAFKKLWKHAIVCMISQEQYESGDLSAMVFEGRHCHVVVGVDEYEGKKKNIVTDFVKNVDEELPF